MTLDEFRKYSLEIVKKVFVRSPIARPPPNRYQVRVPFSRKSIAWLELLMHRARKKGQSLNICHALDGRGNTEFQKRYINWMGMCHHLLSIPAE